MKNSSTTQMALAGILEKSPGLLLVSMILSFVLVAIVQVFYYSNYVFVGKVGTAGIAFAISCGIAVMVQLTRVAFGITGAFEFANGNAGKGIFGILCSLGLTIWSSFELAEIAAVWAGNDASLLYSSQLVLLFIAWAGWVLEVRLAVTIYEKPEEKPDAEQAPPYPVEPNQMTDEEIKKKAQWEFFLANRENGEASQNGQPRETTKKV